MRMGGFEAVCPVVDKAACDGGFIRDGRQVVSSKPSAVGKLGLLELQGAALILSRETHHQTPWIRPRLTAKIFQITNFETRFFAYFPINRFFETFACLDKACYQTIII